MYYIHCTMSDALFFTDTSTTAIYTLSLHDALPIYLAARQHTMVFGRSTCKIRKLSGLSVHEHCGTSGDRKSTRLNSSHPSISYAVFCLKKKIEMLSPSLHLWPYRFEHRTLVGGHGC